MPLPTFPDTYATFSTATLLDAYASGPARLERAVSGLTEAQLRSRPIAGKWSILEIALHVTDSELMGATRIRLAIAQPGITFVAYDQDVWAAEFDYQSATSADLTHALALFKALRQSVLALFRKVPASAWTQRGGLHPESGHLTLRNLLELYADHADRHLAQIRERRALLGLTTDAADVRLEKRLF
jgi:hypothetical protein